VLPLSTVHFAEKIGQLFELNWSLAFWNKLNKTTSCQKRERDTEYALKREKKYVSIRAYSLI
jgi:hypothetical protein